MFQCPGVNWRDPDVQPDFKSKEAIQYGLVVSSGCLVTRVLQPALDLIAVFCISFLVCFFAFVKWRSLAVSAREQVWQYYGWFTALACCGSLVGCLAFASNMRYRFLYLQYSIEVQRVGLFKFLSTDFGRINTFAYDALRWQMSYLIFYPMELACLTIAKLLALDRMINLAKFKQSPTLQKRISVAARVVVIVAVCINIVSIAGGILSAVNLQAIADLYSTGIAKYNANPTSKNALQIFSMEIPAGDSDYQIFNKNADIQLISEVILLALLIGVFVVTGIVCIRRSLALVIAPADTELEENRRTMLRQIGGTVVVIFISFLLRIVYAILQGSANLWISQNLTPEQLNVFLQLDLADPAQLVSKLESINPGSNLNCLFLAAFLLKYPEFQICVILLSSPLTLLVALWGMTTRRARSLLFPSFFPANKGATAAVSLVPQ